MASLTRSRADLKTLVPHNSHVIYYAQRASAGLILAEASPISWNGQGYLGAGAIYTKEQVEGWKKVTDAVHAKGGKIFNQLWHGGRASHPSFIHEQPIAPSSIAIRDPYYHDIMHVVPREMTLEDISIVLEQYRQAAINTKEAGFDGIELHAANGYLVDQFLRDGTNTRTDQYGGSIENRARFALQAIDILIEVYGAKRVGIKISPVGRYNDMYDSDPLALYSYLLQELDKRGIAYVQIREPEDKNHPQSQLGLGAEQIAEVSKTLKPFFKNGAIMINERLTPETAEKALEDGVAELAAFGRHFISNPDYVERVRNDWPLNEMDFKTFYGASDKGYLDYPFYEPKSSLPSANRTINKTGLRTEITI